LVIHAYISPTYYFFITNITSIKYEPVLVLNRPTLCTELALELETQEHEHKFEVVDCQHWNGVPAEFDHWTRVNWMSVPTAKRSLESGDRTEWASVEGKVQRFHS